MVAVLIPAYRPGSALTRLVANLSAEGSWQIFVVDDGSGPQYAALFTRLAHFRRVTVLLHAVNLGKGAALKTGMKYILASDTSVEGIVTADADGQHDPEDIRKVRDKSQENPDALVLGVRSFSKDVPLRSRVGNRITRWLMGVVVGSRLSDTQTGLRAIPRALAQPLLKVSASGYEFELEMLVAARHLGTQQAQVPIRTIYEAGNPSSHFHPWRDSMKIYFVLLRFTMISMLSAAVDNAMFFSGLHLGGNVIAVQAGARLISAAFNYSVVRRAAFHSDEPHEVVLPRYLALVGANLTISCAGIALLSSVLPGGVFAARVLTDSVLFVANFAIQRDLIFTKRAVSSGRGQAA